MLVVLDLGTLEEKRLTIPDVPAIQVAPKDLMVVDIPLFYDAETGKAGLLLRAGGLVTGDAVYAEWDLRKNRIARRRPIVAVDGAKWVSVRPIGYDPGRGVAYVESVRCDTRGGAGGKPYELTVHRIGKKVGTVASFRTRLRYTGKSPYFDPVGRRSMHVEYNEHGDSTAHLVDLDTGTKREFRLPSVIYGFAFDPDGRTGYVYAEKEGLLFTLNLDTGERGEAVRLGRRGHVLDFIAPGVLCLARNRGLHFIDAASLAQRDFLPARRFHDGSTHLEGTLIAPARVLARIYRELSVLDFPGYATGPS